jgi:signal peptidase II
MAEAQWKAYAVAAAVVALDRATKLLIEARVSFQDCRNVIPGFFQIVHSENGGMAFGILDESNWLGRAFLIAFSTAAITLIAAFLRRSRAQMDGLTFYGFALIMGGAAGNLYDRIATGRVTDFLLFFIRDYQWPAFNVADSAITVGCGLVLLEMLRPKRQAANVS